MKYRKYGNTGKDVSIIGFGGMRLPENEDDAIRVIRRASELGVNYFDTAPFYCDDKSEILFGKAFKNMPNDFYVSTKTTVRKDKTGKEMRERLETSLKRLGKDKIDFYHMWCIMDLDQYKDVMKKGGPYEEAIKAKKEGLIDHLVFSTHCKGEDISKIIEDDVFEGVLLGYNVANYKFRQEGVNKAHEKGIGVVVMNPLGGGLVPQHSEYFDFIRENDKETVNQAALRFVLAQKGITLAIPGMGSVSEVEENVEVANNPIFISQGKEEEIKRKLTDKMDKLCTTCGYCLKCPKKIPIHNFLEAYNFKYLQSEEHMKKRIQKMKEDGALNSDKPGPKDCIECGVCEDLCTQKLPIINRLKELAEIVN